LSFDSYSVGRPDHNKLNNTVMHCQLKNLCNPIKQTVAYYIEIWCGISDECCGWLCALYGSKLVQLCDSFDGNDLIIFAGLLNKNVLSTFFEGMQRWNIS